MPRVVSLLLYHAVPVPCSGIPCLNIAWTQLLARTATGVFKYERYSILVVRFAVLTPTRSGTYIKEDAQGRVEYKEQVGLAVSLGSQCQLARLSCLPQAPSSCWLNRTSPSLHCSLFGNTPTARHTCQTAHPSAAPAHASRAKVGVQCTPRSCMLPLMLSCPAPRHVTRVDHSGHTVTCLFMKALLLCRHPTGVEYAPVGDGRHLCMECMATVVVSTKDSQPLYQEVGGACCMHAQDLLVCCWLCRVHRLWWKGQHQRAACPFSPT